MDGVNGNSLFLNDTGTVMELVTNITDFQIRYGEDTNGDGAINIYRTANDVADFAEVKSVEITLTVASGDVEKTYKAIGNIRNRTNI